LKKRSRQELADIIESESLGRRRGKRRSRKGNLKNIILLLLCHEKSAVPGKPILALLVTSRGGASGSLKRIHGASGERRQQEKADCSRWVK
jgi:hypothetical protein